MKLFLATMICCTLLVAAGNAQDKKEPAKKAPAKKEPAKKEAAKEDGGGLKTLSDKVSYGIGIAYGRQLRQSGLDADDVNLKVIVEAMLDALGEKKARVTDAQVQAAFRELIEKKAADLAEKNKQEGAAFLAANGKKEGVTTTKSGLQYKILTAGKGKSPKKSDTVKTHYRGTLIDGTEFDSSYKRKQPATFGVSGVIKGWTEALQLMKVGAKWKLFIPAELAYGETPRSGSPIGPNAVLVFEIELLEIVD